MKFSKEFLKDNLMGPNAVTLLDELIDGQPLTADMRVLDLGCGKGLTSMELADKTGADVFALDLWISATDNLKRFRGFGLKNIVPIHADITGETPFADGFFDAVVSVDSYSYYGRDSEFMDTKLAPLVKQGGLILLAFPGLKKDMHDDLPPELLLSWTPEQMDYMHDIPWWTKILQSSKSVEIIDIKEMKSFDGAWNDWLECDNEYAVGDRKSMNAGAGKYMNLIAVTARKK